MSYSKIDTTYPAKSISYGSSRSASAIKYIVVHYTANKTDKAVNNAKYYANTNTREAGAHYFVDDTSVYQSVDPLKIAWAVGGSKYSNCSTTGGGAMYGKITNANSVSIEMCSTGSAISASTVENAATLIKYLMTKYGISASNVYRHFDVTGKPCPNSTYTSTWSSSDTWIGTNPTQWINLKTKLGDTATGGSTVVTKPSIIYRAYANSVWTSEYKDNAVCGTDGKPFKAFMIKLSDGSAIKYRAHFKGGKWQDWRTGYNGSVATGYAGDGKTDIDAIEIKCDKYDVRYNVSAISSSGFLGEVKDATISGSSSYAGYLGKAVDKMTCRIV